MTAFNCDDYPVPPMADRKQDGTYLDLVSLWRCPIRDDFHRGYARSLAACRGVSMKMCHPIENLDAFGQVKPDGIIRVAVSLHTIDYIGDPNTGKAISNPSAPKLLVENMEGENTAILSDTETLEEIPVGLTSRNGRFLGDVRGRTIEFKDRFGWHKPPYHVAIFENGVFIGSGATQRYETCWLRPASSAHDTLRVRANAVAARDTMIRALGPETFVPAHKT